MNRLFLIIALCMTYSHPYRAQEANLEYNFGSKGCGDCGWFVVVDGVMGGLSSGLINVNDSGIVMRGAISLENNGGFASLRTPFAALDLSQYKELVIRYASSGQNFSFTLNNYRRFWQPRFKATLPVTEGEWKTETVTFESFAQYRFDERIGGAPSQTALQNILRLGLISSDKVASEYMMQIDFIRFQ